LAFVFGLCIQVKLREELEDQQAQFELAAVDKEVAEEGLEKATKELEGANQRIAQLEAFKKTTEDQEEQKRQASTYRVE